MHLPAAQKRQRNRFEKEREPVGRIPSMNSGVEVDNAALAPTHGEAEQYCGVNNDWASLTAGCGAEDEDGFIISSSCAARR
jgi:hypothetical protein